MVENSIFKSFNFINIFFLSRSYFFKSPKSLQFINRLDFTAVCVISVEVVRICHYTKKELLAHQFGMILKMAAEHQQERRRIGA